jgi:hypothetical protein
MELCVWSVVGSLGAGAARPVLMATSTPTQQHRTSTVDSKGHHFDVKFFAYVLLEWPIMQNFVGLYIIAVLLFHLALSCLSFYLSLPPQKKNPTTMYKPGVRAMVMTLMTVIQ